MATEKQVILDIIKKAEVDSKPPLKVNPENLKIEKKEEKRRKSDFNRSPKNIESSLVHYFNSLTSLRKTYAMSLFWLLCGEVSLMFLVLFFTGFKLIHLEQWFVAIFTNVIIIQTVVTIQIVVSNLFPKKNIESEILEYFRDKH